MKTNRGFGLLFALLLGSALLILLFTRIYLKDTPSTVVTKQGTIESQEVTNIEAAKQNINTAKSLQEKMNQQNQQIDTEMKN